MPYALQLTTLGETLTVSGVVNVATIAVGSTDGSLLTDASTALGSEVWRGSVISKQVAGSTMTFTVIIPVEDGGWNIREIALFDDAGNLIAFGAFPTTYKPALADLAGASLKIKASLTVANIANLSLEIDPEALTDAASVATAADPDLPTVSTVQQAIDAFKDPNTTGARIKKLRLTTGEWADLIAATTVDQRRDVSGTDSTIDARVHFTATGKIVYDDLTLPTVAAMETWFSALAGSLVDGQNAVLDGYHARGDGGGGRFVFDSVRVTAADGFMYFDGGGLVVTGRMVRRIGGDRVITPAMAGAKGDNANDDTAAMLAFAAFANAAGEDSYVLDFGPKGSIYRVTQTIKISAQNIEIRGREARIKPIGAGFSTVVYTNTAAENTWAAATDYLFGRVLKSGAEYYAVETGGTSGAVAPTVTGGGTETLNGVVYRHLDAGSCTFVALTQGSHYSWVFQPALWLAGVLSKVGHVRTICESMTATFGTGILIGRDTGSSWSGNILERVTSTDAPWVDVAIIFPEQFTIVRPLGQQVSGAGSHIGVLVVRPFQIGLVDARGLRMQRHPIYIDGGTSVECHRAEGLQGGSHQIVLHNCDGVILRQPDIEAATIARENKGAGVAIFQSSQVTIERPYLASVQPPILYEDAKDVEIFDPRMTDSDPNEKTFLWSATTFTAGDYVYGPTAKKWYKLLTAGGDAAANEPVHASGDVTGADDYEWRYVRDGSYFLEATAADAKSENIEYQANLGLYSLGVVLSEVYLRGMVDPAARTLESRQTYPQPVLLNRPQREIIQVPFAYTDVGGYSGLRANSSWQPFDIPKGARLIDAGIEVTEAFAAASGSFAARLVFGTDTSAYWGLEAYLIYGGADISPPGPLTLDDIYDRTPDGRYGMRMGFGSSLGNVLRGHLASGELAYPADFAGGLTVVNGRYPAFATTGIPYREGSWIYAELPDAAGGPGIYRVLEARPGRCTLEAAYTASINKGFSGVSDNGGNVQCTGMSGHLFQAGDWANVDFASGYADGIYQVLSIAADSVTLNMTYSAGYGSPSGTCRAAVKVTTAGRLAGATVLADLTLRKSIANTLVTATAGRGYIWLEYELTGLQRALA